MKEHAREIINFFMAIIIGVGIHTIIKTVLPNPDTVPELIRLMIALGTTAAVEYYLKMKN